ncbi:MAG: class I mannose-6-phosphate isomerase [Sandaracinaceae bacterium]|nr:class I mannose-6-phosphate isomerase [Sandaracinaceae bacterium]
MTPPKNWQGPLRLRPQFTPQSRTPWGGTRIAELYGKELGLPAGERVGEAWVLSLDPQFPSRVGDALLSEQMDCALLVKLLDAAQPLSVQIHPSDDYVGLRPGECGKPEAWYVVERDPGAGLFLGFREGVGATEVRAALDANADVSQLMHFAPVEPGDFFLIEAGTPHAIGAGVTLVEPQRVIAGSSGVTYRYWDWGRRYDAAGVPSEDGKARELHIDHAIAVTDWARVTRYSFIDTIRRRAGVPVLTGLPVVTMLAEHPSSADLQVARLEGTGSCTLPAWSHVAMGLTVLEGSVQFANGEVVHRGETAALPEGAAGLPVTLSGAHALVMTARPA